MLDIETLRLIWWGLIGFLFIGFAVTDGYDFGAAILLPLITRNEIERRLLLDSLRPFWEGNQVWIILGAGAIFAAWPFVYAVAFSGFYFLILLLLLTMGISRPVSFKYRDKLPNYFWKRFWDWTTFVGGLVPALLFGILIGNILLGADFYFDNELRVFYSGSFANLFQGFAWWCGLTSVIMLIMHGGLWLGIKTENPLYKRALYWSQLSSLLLILFFALGGVWIAYGINGYTITSSVDPRGYSNPLHKDVIQELGGWLKNYTVYPYAMLAPGLGFLGAFGVFFSISLDNVRIAFLFSCLSIAGIISTVGVSMFPFILPSSTHYSSSLLVWDSSSSQLTLLVMLFAVIIFIPLIIIYTSWVYYALRGKVSLESIQEIHQHKLE